MQVRNFAGVAVGALAAGLVLVPGQALAAEALSGTTSLSCIYGSFEPMTYTAAAEVTVDGTAVTVTLPDVTSDVLSGVPAFVGTVRSSASVTATIGGQEVLLTGTHDYARRALSTGFAVAPLTGTLAAPLDGDRVTLGDITFSVYTSAAGAATNIACTVTTPETTIRVSEKFDCVYGTFAPVRFEAEGEVKIDGSAAELTLNKFPAMGGVPVFVTVSSATTTANIDLGTEVVSVHGSKVLSPAEPLKTGFTIPAAQGVLTKAGTPASAKVTSLVVDVVAAGTPGTMTCTPLPPAAATTTTLVGASSAANKVSLTATTPAGVAGSVTFKSGEKVVGTVGAADGKAVLNLTGVAAGKVSYTATFTPTDADAHAPSTSAAIVVDVKAPVVVDPPVVKGASSAKVSKVVYSKKTKKAKISVAVTGKKGAATGKATIVIKKGSKTVQKKVVSLKSGKASWTSKKISKKGTYKVTVKYAGSTKYKASKTSKAKSFKVK